MKVKHASVPPNLEPRATPPAALPRVLRPRRAAPADAVRPTRAEINLGHLRHNLQVVQANGRRPRTSAACSRPTATATARRPWPARSSARGSKASAWRCSRKPSSFATRASALPFSSWVATTVGAWGEVLARDVMPVIYDVSQAEGIAREVRLARRAAPVGVALQGRHRHGAPRRAHGRARRGPRAHPRRSPRSASTGS